MDGSATFTMVLSSPTMNRLMQQIDEDQQAPPAAWRLPMCPVSFVMLVHDWPSHGPVSGSVGPSGDGRLRYLRKYN